MCVAGPSLYTGVASCCVRSTSAATWLPSSARADHERALTDEAQRASGAASTGARSTMISCFARRTSRSRAGRRGARPSSPRRRRRTRCAGCRTRPRHRPKPQSQRSRRSSIGPSPLDRVAADGTVDRLRTVWLDAVRPQRSPSPSVGTALARRHRARACPTTPAAGALRMRGRRTARPRSPQNPRQPARRTDSPRDHAECVPRTLDDRARPDFRRRHSANGLVVSSALSMAAQAFTRNYTDHSNDTGYQFEFHCDKCGNGYRSSFQASALGVGSKIAKGLGSLFGGSKLWSAGDAADTSRTACAARAGTTRSRRRSRRSSRSSTSARAAATGSAPRSAGTKRAASAKRCAPDLAEEAAHHQAHIAPQQVAEKMRNVDRSGTSTRTRRCSRAARTARRASRRARSSARAAASRSSQAAAQRRSSAPAAAAARRAARSSARLRHCGGLIALRRRCRRDRARLALETLSTRGKPSPSAAPSVIAPVSKLSPLALEIVVDGLDRSYRQL